MATPRLTSAMVVAAATRRVFAAGGFAAVLHRGAEEAGAIFLIERRPQQPARLYGPAAQTAYDDERPAERIFRLVMEDDDPSLAGIEAKIARERRFDADLWLVELEGGPAVVELVTVEAES